MEKTKFKMTRGTALIIIIFMAVLLAAAVIIRAAPGGAQGGFQSLINASTLSGREKYLKNLGWEIDASTEESQEVLIPAEFNEVMTEYNKLQKQQGFDLSAYAGESCTRYTYAVTNYPEGGNVLACIYIKGRSVIAGDIHSAGMNGFMHTLV